MSKSGKRKSVVWHPLVHQRFEEDLYFFLLSVKPFETAKVANDIRELVSVFGVKEFCAYRILGQYDVLLRVWLPSTQGPQFFDKALERIPNLQAIIPFHVTSIRDHWRFKSSTDPAVTLERLSSITPQVVKMIQEGNDLKQKELLIEAGLLAEVDDYRKNKRTAIKAFVAISEPRAPEIRKRQKTAQDIVALIDKDRRFTKVTVHYGLGFSWLLIKLVSDEFYSFGELVERISDEFGADGVSTNTFISATDAYVEGECISTISLDSNEGNERVRLFVPELYSVSGIGIQMRDDIEMFVSKKILENGLAANDQLAFQRYFKAVLNDNGIEAFTSLYPKFVETEQMLRNALVQYASGHGGVESLLRELDPKKEMVKSAMTISLAYSLRGCKQVLQKRFPSDKWLLELKEITFDQIASFRNKVMHGAGFHREKDWKDFALAALELLQIKAKLLERFGAADSPSEAMNI